jgi:hypothetical protein
MSFYQESIREILAQEGHIGKYDPRHIEAWMRMEHRTLDGLSKGQFEREVLIAAQCVDEAGVDLAEQMAVMEGFGPVTAQA